MSALTDWYDKWKHGYLAARKGGDMSDFERRNGIGASEDASPVSRLIYDALMNAHQRLQHVCTLHGCPKGEDCSVWLTHALSTNKANRIAIEVWDQYNADMELLLTQHGWRPGTTKMEWLRQQLQELHQLRAIAAVTPCHAADTGSAAIEAGNE